MKPSLRISRRNFLRTGAIATASLLSTRRTTQARSALPQQPIGHEAAADIVIVGGSLGGVAAALAAARLGRTVVLTEETAWIGGQATTQAVPLDEHPWMEKFGCNRAYRQFRDSVRDYYRRNFPLIDAARHDPTLNPGAGWVSGLCFEPRVGIAVLMEMLAPHLSAGRITLLMHHRPVAVAMEGDVARAVTVRDTATGAERTLHGAYILDATDLGELLPLAKIEHVVGAEAQSDTGEPNARPDGADPREQMGFTHTMALEYRPGEDHTIDKPADYDRWKTRIRIPDFFGVHHDYKGQPSDPNHYVTSQWNFRRLLCRGNFQAGAFASDVTSLMTANQYNGVLLGVAEDERRREMANGRQLTLSALYWLQTEAPNDLEHRTGFPGLRPRGDVMGTADGLAQYPYIREACRIRAEFTVLEQHFRTDFPATKNGPMKYHDSVGVSGYRIDVHKPAKGGHRGSMTTANQGKHWTQQIPLGALIPVRVENLLPACKNLGVTAVTNGSFRVHPGEWSVGEAAGALAAHALNTRRSPRQIRNTPEHLADFQRELVAQGFELDWPEPLVAYSYFSYHDVKLNDLDTFYFGEARRRS
jgi:hypothetical protein